MTKQHLTTKEKKGKVKPDAKQEPRERTVDGGADLSGLARLQNQVGNRAVQRLLAQRSSDGGFDLDDDTAGRINRERGGGQPLDGAVQARMGETMGQDFSGVRIHTSSEADALNHQLNAKAFTTGQDIFFKEGAYQPHSGGGQELIAHELTHVVQQGSGAVGGGGDGMRVNAPDDVYEQEADSVSKQATQSEATPAVQRQEEEEPAPEGAAPEEAAPEEGVQLQEEEEAAPEGAAPEEAAPEEEAV